MTRRRPSRPGFDYIQAHPESTRREVDAACPRPSYEALKKSLGIPS